MKLKKLYLKGKENIYRILNKDYMEILIERYRLNGAIIGENVRAFSPITSSEPYLIEIKDNVTVSTGVKFITHDNSIIKITDKGTDLVGKIIVGNNCFIGTNSIILPGVTLADDIIVGAGSVVTKSFLQEGCILGGNPAKVISDTQKYREKYNEYVFDFGMKNQRINGIEKKQMILDNKIKWIKK